MEIKKTAQQLSEIEQNALNATGNVMQSFEELEKQSGLQKDSLHRALQWLSQKQLIELSTAKKTAVELTQRAQGELPERTLFGKIEKEMQLRGLQKTTGLSEQEFSAALGKLKKNNFISIISGNASLTEAGKEFLAEKFPEEKLLEKIAKSGFEEDMLEESEKNLLSDLFRRGLVQKNEKNFYSAKITASGLEAKKIIATGINRAYNISDPTPTIHIGKKQPYVQFLNHIRKTLLQLGFSEMPEQLITQEFYNFDVLFQPQNHPARTWTDTYQLKQPTHGDLPDKKKVQEIKCAHENGGKSGSLGWRYKWDPKIASKLMPNAHGTSADARQMVQGIEKQAKYFVINRCYRPDVLDATHLVEFNQLDGFIVGHGLNFSHLLGILKDFAQKIAGATEVKFFPDYYPFTEPSCELAAKHPEVGWIEIGGAGIFRPEITENLGIKEPVLAWGLGVDRLAMIKLKIKDIRDLFSDDLDWLRKTKAVFEQ
ncbi:MAG: phenylalanine--tRNA ligase subunit alpha [archaeon]